MRRLRSPAKPTLERELQIPHRSFDGSFHGVETRRTPRANAPTSLRSVPEGAALTPGRTGCSNPSYRAAGGAVAKERAGGMQRRFTDPASSMRARPGAGRAGPGARR
jgi:hypothetical protein